MKVPEFQQTRPKSDAARAAGAEENETRRNERAFALVGKWSL